MPDLLAWLRVLPPAAVLITSAGLITAETALLIGVVLPGSSAVLALGVLARAGVVSPLIAAGAAAGAAVLGGQLAYVRGRRGGSRTPRRLYRPRQRAVRLLRAAGPVGLCLCQWLAGARTVAPRLAASAGIGYPTFAAASVPTATVWASTLVLVGYQASALGQQLYHWLGVLGAAVTAAIAAYLVLRPHRGHFGQSTPDSSDAGSELPHRLSRQLDKPTLISVPYYLWLDSRCPRGKRRAPRRD